eukprot:jgi/Botrbrau1/4432/Bobra.0348s0021.1
MCNGKEGWMSLTKCSLERTENEPKVSFRRGPGGVREGLEVCCKTGAGGCEERAGGVLQKRGWGVRGGLEMCFRKWDGV